MPTPQVVDPAVSPGQVRPGSRRLSGTGGDHLPEAGMAAGRCHIPEVLVAFAATKLRPAPIVAAVVVDFTDYDLQPPSVRFVDPFTREKLLASNVQFPDVQAPRCRACSPGSDRRLDAAGHPAVTLAPIKQTRRLSFRLSARSPGISRQPSAYGGLMAATSKFWRRLFGLHPGENLDLRHDAGMSRGIRCGFRCRTSPWA